MKSVTVSRTEEVEQGRSKLPILGQEQEIMEMINNHGVVVLSGEEIENNKVLYNNSHCVTR